MTGGCLVFLNLVLRETCVVKLASGHPASALECQNQQEIDVEGRASGRVVSVEANMEESRQEKQKDRVESALERLQVVLVVAEPAAALLAPLRANMEEVEVEGTLSSMWLEWED